jgi:2,4-dienoyl-CoA reductase-like NADH-dependent reductase (Old Yellow Enzyme family)
MTTPTLFTPMTIRSVTFRNRIWVPPMCQYSVIAEDGVPTSWHQVHLGAMAAGGAGLIIAEATAVSPEGRISPRDVGLWNDEQRDAWKPIVEFIRGQGAVAGIQLAHAGRKASVWADWGFEDKSGTKPISEGGWQTIAPSAIAFPGYDEPREMTDGDILNVEHAFVAAAQRAVAAGFEVLEIHAAHGYLLHEFLSPLSNTRTDEYGGALENRARLLVRIVTNIRAAVGNDVAIFVRFSATDWTPEGWNEEECAVVADWCLTAGADLFDVSSGGNITGVSIPVGQGYQVPLANFIKQHSHGPTAAVGMITEAEYANSVITSGQADAVLVGREFMRDAHWGLRAAVALGENISYWPPQYKRARPRI